jgi:hypothetical protein
MRAISTQFVTGPNLEALAQRNTMFYGPIAEQSVIVKSHNQYEPHRVTLREHMAEEKSADQLTRRHSEGERPHAVTQQQMSLRQHSARLPQLLACFATFVRSWCRAGARASPSPVGL